MGPALGTVAIVLAAGAVGAAIGYVGVAAAIWVGCHIENRQRTRASKITRSLP